MNIIQLKEKYNKIFSIKIKDQLIYYRSFTAKEMILLMKNDNENKYKYEMAREAVINKDVFDSLSDIEWPIKEMIYDSILKISNLGSKEEIHDKKLLIKNNLDTNPFLIMIKHIIKILPSVSFETLLECNSDQLLFYIVLCEQLSGKDIISDEKSEINNPIPSTRTKKKPELNQEDLINNSMATSEDTLKNALGKHGVKVKDFIPKEQRDPFQE